MAWFSRQSPRMKSRAGPTSGAAGLTCSSGLSREERRIEVSARLYHAWVPLGAPTATPSFAMTHGQTCIASQCGKKTDSLRRPRHAAKGRGAMAAMLKPQQRSQQKSCPPQGWRFPWPSRGCDNHRCETKVQDRPSPCAARNRIAAAKLAYEYPNNTSCVPSVLQTDVSWATHGKRITHARSSRASCIGPIPQAPGRVSAQRDT